MTDTTIEDAIDSLSASDYERAFRSIERSDNDNEMLRVHYGAPDQTITATQMARAMGFNVFGASNLHYGRLARRIGEEFGLIPRTMLYTLVVFEKPDREWLWIMRPEVAEAVERLGIADGYNGKLPEELSSSPGLLEGATYRLTVNAYERNSVARRNCISHFGATCGVCGFRFGICYGPSADGYIHVHHLRPLSEIGSEYVIDPVADLVPVCPNCHAVIHLRNPPYSISEVREMIELARKIE